ncbi:MAG TPA: CHASE2 domain-containing protein [Candidatus Obscuribacterales bacterium]
MSNNSTLRLEILRVERTCVFKLSWGQNQQIGATLNYPESLTTLYQDWQRAYLSYYKSKFRGRVEGAGTIASLPVDWHAKLVQAEASLLSEFHHWLRSASLNEITEEIASAAVILKQTTTSSEPRYVDVFLTCNTLDLERLPWESWKIGVKLRLSPLIRLVRTPVNIRHEFVEPLRRRPRILVILGDDTGLSFEKEKAALKKMLSRLATIEFVGWKPEENKAELRTKIRQSIADEQGWDGLFFAGHSNETELTGGELAIAPGVAMSISEIKSELILAKQRGLQFAIFNSCSGISIATSLLDLGLSQVAVMREPIHNDVAQIFLVRFLENLAAHKDVHEALIAACQALQVETNYPSAYLIPSLFYHPQAVLFRIKPSGIKEVIRQWLPVRHEAIALSALALISYLLPVQDFLVDQRVYAQAVYRSLTHQVATVAPPPVLLVQIDEQSIEKAKIPIPNPMNRYYLASLVNKLKTLDAKVVGIDYLLNRPDAENGKSDRFLADALQKPVLGQQCKNYPCNRPKFVFAAVQDHHTSEWLEILPDIVSPNSNNSGDVNQIHWYMNLLPQKENSSYRKPFAYLLTSAYRSNFPRLGTGGVGDLLGTSPSKKPYPATAARLNPITTFSYGLRQMWLHPLIDFSLPPNQVYERIPAWQLLDNNADSPLLRHIKQQVVIIAPGGYGDAGLFKQDQYPLPAALSFWYESVSDPRERITGGEAHAYMVHHFLNNRLVVPIPDLWMLPVAVVLGKAIALTLLRRQKLRMYGVWVIVGTITVSGLVSLQLYITSAVLLPWVLPTVTLCTFTLPVLLRKQNYA